MAFTSPTFDDLADRYPEFGDFDEAYVEAVIAEAVAEVDDSWIEGDRVPAILALTAHWLAMSETVGVTGETVGTLASTVTSERVGPIAVTYQVMNRNTSSLELSSTAYGTRYIQLQKRSNPAVLVV